MNTPARTPQAAGTERIAMPPVAHRLSDDGTFPNSRLPALIYPAAVTLPDRDPASAFEQLFAQHGWTGAWRNGVYSFQHYHSTAHEVLGVYAGSARVQLGGDSGPVVTVSAGDVVVIPAGVAHKNLGASADFACVGAYPDGTGPDLLRGKPGERPAADRRIARVAVPATDPVAGRDGPLVVLWPVS
jgi:uncharacterized protein YjlB